MERKEGYYWVNFRGEFLVALWMPSHSRLGLWYLHGSSIGFRDEDFKFIDKNRIKQPGKMPD